MSAGVLIRGQEDIGEVAAQAFEVVEEGKGKDG